MVVQYVSNVVETRHPSYLSSITDWQKWRICYNGGEEFRRQYLRKFTQREDAKDFQARQEMTPIPTYARVAINDVRNAIFQRMRDITRRGGSLAYQQAVNGLNLGVDLRGNTMNGFLGIKVLTELLIMGRVGVYVDSPRVSNTVTLADAQSFRPYLYFYPIEDILSWTCAKPDEPSTFQALLLRDVVLNFDQQTYLPTTTVERFRRLWINQETGKVNLQFLDVAGNPVDRDGKPVASVEALELDRIPFVLLDIGDSMIKDVVHHQIALLNLVSSDVNYALLSNFPFYIEQTDGRSGGSYLKNEVGQDGTATAGGQPGTDGDIRVGATQGRTYDMKANPPGFINPSSEPLKASMDLQAKLEDDIRKLVHLAVANTANRATAESKSIDNQGLESGLSYIGLVLEAAERQIVEFWAAYEERNVALRDVATIKYPDRYSLKTDADRISEASNLVKLMYAVPGQKVKRELAKAIVMALLGGKISVADIQSIFDEIDTAPYATSSPETIISAVEAGLCGEQTGSMALGFGNKEYLQARKDHALRAIRVLQAQTTGGVAGQGTVNSDPAARGVPDLSVNRAAGEAERAASRDTTLNDTIVLPVRGPGKNNSEEP